MTLCHTHLKKAILHLKTMIFRMFILPGVDIKDFDVICGKMDNIVKLNTKCGKTEVNSSTFCWKLIAQMQNGMIMQDGVIVQAGIFFKN